MTLMLLRLLDPALFDPGLLGTRISYYLRNWSNAVLNGSGVRVVHLKIKKISVNSMFGITNLLVRTPRRPILLML